MQKLSNNHKTFSHCPVFCDSDIELPWHNRGSSYCCQWWRHSWCSRRCRLGFGSWNIFWLFDNLSLEHFEPLQFRNSFKLIAPGDVSRTAQYFRLLKVARIIKTLRIIRIFKLGMFMKNYLFWHFPDFIFKLKMINSWFLYPFQKCHIINFLF